MKYYYKHIKSLQTLADLCYQRSIKQIKMLLKVYILTIVHTYASHLPWQ